MFDSAKRLKELRRELRKRSIESLLVTCHSNVTYLSGFPQGDSILLITPDAQFFLTDSRYIQQARSSLRGFTVVEIESSTYDTIGNIAGRNRLKKLGFESMNLPYAVVKNLEERIGKTRLVPAKDIVEQMRSVKDAIEIRLIKSSIATVKKVLNSIIKHVRPGVSENYLNCLIESEFIDRGARAGFQAIVASGDNSSKPHAEPTDKKIRDNDIVMIDIGCRLGLYNSDITRMVFLGNVRDKLKQIYRIVKDAQDKALEKIKPGRKIAEIDMAARKHIIDSGYGKFFNHSLGHGVGLDVHEEPSISGKSKGILKAGMVFTVEPAIYIHGLGGVRIEDMVLVTEKGCDILTK